MERYQIIKWIKRRDSGEVMLESVLVVSIVLIMSFVIIGMGVLFYTAANVQTVANEIASEVAAGYKYSGKKDNLKPLNDNDISLVDVKEIRLYRSILKKVNMKGFRERVPAYYKDRVSLISFGKSDIISADVETKAVTDNVGRIHIVCDVNYSSNFFLEDILQAVGVLEKDNSVLHAVGRAEVLDITGYSGSAHFLNYLEYQLDENGNFKNIRKIHNDAVNTIHNTQKLIEDVKNIITKGSGLYNSVVSFLHGQGEDTPSGNYQEFSEDLIEGMGEEGIDE